MTQEAHSRAMMPAVMEGLTKHGDFVHAIVGPRQVGKTTAAEQIRQKWKGSTHYAAADQILPPGPEWIEAQWSLAARSAAGIRGPHLLILDEIQKVARWSESIKHCWDAQKRTRKTDLALLILGSSSLLLHKGLSESLAGRFLLYRFPHWTFPECRKAFGWSLDEWLFFGGYPGSSRLLPDEGTWRAYIVDSLIEATLTRDVIQMQTVTKPTLLRHLFAFSMLYPAQIFSYNKMLGQLQDAGNTTTLAHYLQLLETAFLLTGLEQYSRGTRRKRGSSPKLVAWNNALVNAMSGKTFHEARSDAGWWGRIVENAVGAHLLNHLQDLRYQISYWRQGNDEVDYVVQAGPAVWGIEVKSGRPGKAQGLAAFKKRYPKSRLLVIGTGGFPLEEFFSEDPREIFG